MRRTLLGSTWRSAIFRAMAWGATCALMSGGCSSSSAGAAASAITAAAVAATQPSTRPVLAGTTAASDAKVKSQSILGRWLVKGPVMGVDGTEATGVTDIIVFGANGAFSAGSRMGNSESILYARGNFKAAGGVLVTAIGKSSQTLIYKISGGELVLTNPKLHQSKIYYRE